MSSDRRNNLAPLQEQVVVIPPERRCVGFVLVRLHRRKNSILACLFQTTHTKKPWAALTPRPTAFSQVRNGRKKKSRRRDHFVSPTACRCDVLLRYLQLRVNVFPKKAQYDLGRHETHERQVHTHETESTTLQPASSSPSPST